MSRRRTMLMAMTALSLLGFLVDQFLIGDPAPAEAAAAKPRAERKATPPTQAAQKAETAADPSLPYLDKLEMLDGGRDVFAMTSEMLLYYKTLEQETAEEERGAVGGPKSAMDFTYTHTLEGTFTTPSGRMAVINGEVVKPGDIIDDFTVARIAPFGVELHRNRERVVLVLPQPGAEKKKAPAPGQNRSAKPPARK